jgi:hypothetical protein
MYIIPPLLISDVIYWTLLEGFHKKEKTIRAN